MNKFVLTVQCVVYIQYTHRFEVSCLAQGLEIPDARFSPIPEQVQNIPANEETGRVYSKV